MPDIRTHRGPHPEDARLFGPEARPVLAEAARDLCWLLSKGYAPDSSLKLVGDRYALAARQRAAVARCSTSDRQVNERLRREAAEITLRNRPLWLDGYNVLTTVEAALGGGLILVARDGAFRDMASMHGSYRKVSETLPALKILGELLAEFEVSECVWLLDRPVSNSGRLKKIMEWLAAENHWPWRIELAASPDAVLSDTPEIVATADSAILDRCKQWFNLAAAAVTRRVPHAWILDLSGGP
ncbi:MAG: DUF434 domain-containing protein [Pirellulales bacterium]|nr:DUF434 domain-containing protein [Pirellulales bacterium]